jgi:serine/threonine-protein kinase HipA
MIDDVAEAAHGWIDRCTEIGFTPRETELLADMVSARITSLQRPRE